MRLLYNILFFVFFWICSPFYFLKMWRRGGWRRDFGQRFGRYSGKLKQALTNRRVIWLHAVSVGEVNVCTQLIRELEPRLPHHKLVVSTTTSTGMGELRKKLPVHIEKIYYPVDFPGGTRRAIMTMNPEAVVLVEAEIWPNFLWRLNDFKVPVFLVNARLSEKSFRGYRRFGFLFRPMFRAFTGAGAQNEADAEKLKQLGCRPEAVEIVGNLKFDAAKLDGPRVLDVPAMLRQLGVAPGAPVLVAGSTHAGEEKILAAIAQRLRRKFPDLFLVLVPRHFERSRAVGEELAALGVKFAYRTEITAATLAAPGGFECLLVNTTGELRYFYDQATVIFVGKSLTADGGQNPIEPGALGKPMVFGPRMQNFTAIAAAFVQHGGALQVADEAELGKALENLLADESRRAELGRHALGVVKENQGAAARTAEMVARRIKA